MIVTEQRRVDAINAVLVDVINDRVQDWKDAQPHQRQSLEIKTENWIADYLQLFNPTIRPEPYIQLYREKCGDG